jgi:hypothetical protein
VKERGHLPASKDPLNASIHGLPGIYGKMTELQDKERNPLNKLR